MAALEFTTTTIEACCKKEVTHETILSAGDKVKMELGEDELDELVPVGKRWEIVANIRLVETDA